MLMLYTGCSMCCMAGVQYVSTVFGVVSIRWWLSPMSSANCLAQFASLLKSSPMTTFGFISLVNESTSPKIFFSSCATKVESSPPDKNTPNFLMPSVDILTVACASCLNCSLSSAPLELGVIKVLWLCTNFLCSML